MMLRKIITVTALTIGITSTVQATTYPSEAEMAACKAAMDHHTQVCTADIGSIACQKATENVGRLCAYQASTSQPSAPAHVPAGKPVDCMAEKHAAVSECSSNKRMPTGTCLKVLKPEEDKCNSGQPYDFSVWKTQESEETILAKKCQNEKHAAVSECRKKGKNAVQCLKMFASEEAKCNAGKPYNYAVE